MDTATEGRAAAFGDMAKLIPALPLETRCPPFPLHQLRGFWLPKMILPGVAAVHTRFKPRPDDVFLASFPKSGTTWLKALAFATLTRAENPPSDPGHPLRLRSPHDCVSLFELPAALAANAGEEDVFEALPSQRMLATHLPYILLPETKTDSCRVVYVCRDPKDALVSGWFFTIRSTAATATSKGAVGGEDDIDDVPPPPPYSIEDAFELFCEGRCIGGPQWLHVLGYWEESRRRPDKVLFLRYEEMLRDPASNVKRLPEFMGCPFTAEEETAGTVEAVVELCSLDSLKGSKANQGSGSTTSLAIEKANFFRKGAAGDWRNHLSAEMTARLDEIVDGALQGSGLSLAFGGVPNDSE